MKIRKTLISFVLCAGIVSQIGCGSPTNEKIAESGSITGSSDAPSALEISPTIKAVVDNALDQTQITRQYSQGYVVIPYPNGDLPSETGACTDVVIRAFRKAGVDLQKEVHEDMSAHFAVYPQKWGMSGPDTNIDHRRVPNLQTFFTRKGKALPVTSSPGDYKPGDVVTWDLDGKGMTHIGLVSDRWSESKHRFLLVHNIGGGANLEDVLFNWKVTGHFRYF